MMKLLLVFVTLTFVSCASDVKDWNMPDPNDSANVASDVTNSRHYTSDSIGVERRGLTEQELRDLAKPKEETTKRFRGELSVGFGARF